MVTNLGYALSEALYLDDSRIIHGEFPITGFPWRNRRRSIQTILLESPWPPDRLAPRGIGEIGLATIVPAVANALESARDVRITELPMRPEKVPAAIE